MSSIVISGDTSGAITLAAPAVAGTNTATLPASTGTILTTGSPQSGGVIQVVNSIITIGVTTTSTSFVTTGHSVTITPKFSTSKILLMVSAVFGNYGAYNTALTLYRNGTTNLATGGGTPCLMDARIITTSQQWYVGGSFNFYDSPATTSSTTYTVYYLTDTSSTAVYAAAPGVPSNSVATLTALEIAA
jgi:hypothetical protein